MPHLLQLPNELLLQVIDLIPEDIEAFALSCVQIDRVAVAHLQRHRNRKREYTHIICGKVAGIFPEPKHFPLQVLRDIIVDGAITRYPRKITIGQLPKVFIQSSKQLLAATTRDIREHYGDRIKAKVAFCSFWTAKERIKLGEEIIKGVSNTVIAFLITILPNLEEIHFTNRYNPNAHFLSIIQKISSRKHTWSAEQYPLTRLSTVDMDHGSNRLKNFLPFLGLPALQKMCGTNVSGRFERDWRDTSSCASLIQVDIQDSIISYHDLNVLLGKTSALQDFSYQIVPCGDSYGTESPKPRLVIESLKHNSSTTLKSLTLTTYERSYPQDRYLSGWFIYRLREFCNLTSIRLEATMLFDIKKNESLPYLRVLPQESYHLVDQLPSSTQTLTLEGWIPQDLMIVELDLLVLKPQKLPDLKRITYETDAATDIELKSDCVEEGFTLEQKMAKVDTELEHLLALNSMKIEPST